MTSEKLTILCDFRNMIISAWTFEKLTKEEKDRLLNRILTTENVQLQEVLKGKRSHCWAILQNIYSSYLIALDYNPTTWRREENESEVF